MHASLLANSLLSLLFLASGCAALIYEIVWFQQLGMSLGASAISLAILLTSFMGGMCLGSLVFPHLKLGTRSPLLIYAGLELLLAVCGFTLAWVLPHAGSVYWTLSRPGPYDLILRAMVALLLLTPPTMLMGATLPAVSRAFEATAEGLSRLGWFYALNTLGAVLGCLSAGLFLLPYYDVYVATGVAVALNLSVAVMALLVDRAWPLEPATSCQTEMILERNTGGTVVGLVLAVSGLTALGSEVIWTRLLALLFGPTVYTFSIILAVFLLGLSLGSGIGSYLARRLKSPGLSLGIVQVMLMLALPYASYMVVNVLPYWWGGYDEHQATSMKLLHDLTRAFVTLFPATCLWGASFPLGIAACAGTNRDASSLVGKMYAANTLGAIAGALLISLVVIPNLGTTRAVQILTFLAGIAGCLMYVREWFFRSHAGESRILHSRLMPRLTVAGVLVLAIVSTQMVSVVPAGLLAWGRHVTNWSIPSYPFVGEGWDSSIVISETPEGVRSFHVAGKVEASNTASDLRTQRLLGHLPAMAHGQPRKVLVICCGSAMTCGAILRHPSVEKLTLCEIEKQVTVAARTHFSEYNFAALDDPRLEIVIDDGRHFLATTKEKYDIISTDPIHPWVRGAATLYTEEFYELCREHLNPGGIVTQWVPLYESSEEAVKSELATFLKVFPKASLWSGQGRENGYDVIALGMLDDEQLNPNRVIESLFTTPEIRDSLTPVGYGEPSAFQEAFVGYGQGIKSWVKGAAINRDANLRLQYLAGLTQAPKSAQEILYQIRTQHERPVEHVAKTTE